MQPDPHRVLHIPQLPTRVQLAPGDVIEIEADRVGVLRNTIEED